MPVDSTLYYLACRGSGCKKDESLQATRQGLVTTLVFKYKRMDVAMAVLTEPLEKEEQRDGDEIRYLVETLYDDSKGLDQFLKDRPENAEDDDELNRMLDAAEAFIDRRLKRVGLVRAKDNLKDLDWIVYLIPRRLRHPSPMSKERGKQVLELLMKSPLGEAMLDHAVKKWFGFLFESDSLITDAKRFKATGKTSPSALKEYLEKFFDARIAAAEEAFRECSAM